MGNVGPLALLLGLAVLPLGACSERSRAESVPAEQAPAVPRMTLERLDELIRRADEDARRPAPNQWEFSIGDDVVLVIADATADRMRIMTPITTVSDAGAPLMMRMLQANFDSALDARYAIAHDRIWGVFIHPLGDLTDELFLSGLGQVVNVSRTFGATFSSGELVFGGGDSGDLQRQLLEDLKALGKITT